MSAVPIDPPSPQVLANGRRVAVLFSRLSGYMAACLRVLKERYGVELLVVRRPPAREAPFEARHFGWIDHLYDRGVLDREALLHTLQAFRPDAVLVSGWVDDDYLHVARTLRREGALVVAGSDAQWTGSLRQQAARLAAPWYLHTAIDVLWVAGERQRQFASNLGYRGSRCWSGIYACDWDRFSSVRARADRPPAFLFVGRYVPVKGLDVLMEGYRRYRTLVPDPWPLLCAGAGAQGTLLGGCEGVVDRGFVQPDQLPDLMAEASAFVLPSAREPWGVVVQEAAAAGLPLICSDACGAAVHLLQDQWNGFLFETGNAAHLADCMARVTLASPDERNTMSRNSRVLAEQFTPQRWAATFVDGIRALRSERL